MYKLTFYVPVDAKEKVKEALFSVGAGKIGLYDSCAFEIIGTGQFRALDGAHPSIGNIGKLEKISEARVEMVFDDIILKEVVNALKKSHPYETPAFDIIECVEI